MKGDKLYCPACGKYSIDIQELYDSRKAGKPSYIAPKKEHFVWNCPHCGRTGLVNVNQTMIDELIKIMRNDNNYKGSQLFKKFAKDWPQQKALYSQKGSK